MRYRVYATLTGSITVEARNKSEAMNEALDAREDEYDFEWDYQIEPEFDKDAIAINSRHAEG